MAGVGNFWGAKIFSLTFSSCLQLTFPYINIFLHFASALPITFQMVHALGMFLSLFNNCAILRPTGPTTGKWCGNRNTTPFLIFRKIVNRIAEGAMKTDKPQILKRRTNRKTLLYKSDQSAILKPPIFQFKKANCSPRDLLWSDLFHSLPFLLGNWSFIDSSKWH